MRHSREIVSYPQVLRESMVSMAKARQMFPVGILSRGTLERWIRKGVRGVVLETCIIGQKRYTSKEAIERFLERQNERDEDGKPAPVPKIKRYTKNELDRKNRELGLV